jgi:hypothetical protein
MDAISYIGAVHTHEDGSEGSGIMRSRNILGILERQTAQRSGKPAQSLRIAEKGAPSFIVAFDLGAAGTFRLRLVWPGFLSQRCSPYEC